MSGINDSNDQAPGEDLTEELRSISAVSLPREKVRNLALKLSKLSIELFEMSK